MDSNKYVRPQYHNASEAGGSCPNCQVPLVATYTACGNPIVEEQINPSDKRCNKL